MYKEIEYSSGKYNLIYKEMINESINRVINGEYDYNYVSSKGVKELREKIVEFTNIKDITYHDILVTNSSSDSIRVIASLLNRGDTILVEEFTYFGAIDIFNQYELNVIKVKLNSDGIDINDLKDKIKKHNPKMIYVIPTFNNPSGITWNELIRKEFIDIINEYNVSVVEDDPYSLISYDNKKYTKLIELDNKHIIYISSFSKYIAPSFSVGYIISNKSILDKLYLIKRNELCSNGFIQYVVLDYLTYNDLKGIIKEKIREYKKCLKRSINYLNINGYDYKFIPKGGIFMLVEKDNKISRFNICYMK